jgi:hypothetical protein
MMISRKLAIGFIPVFLITLGLGLIISPVLAAAPHFSETPTITKNSDQSITANFKAAALGKKVANITLSSDATANIQCLNPGGNGPPPKKVDFKQIQNQSVNLKPKDGKIKDQLSLGPPTFPSASDVCPNGNWNTKVLSLTYENPSLNIQQKDSDVLKFNFGNVMQ